MKNFGPIIGWRNYHHTHALCGVSCVACKKIYYPKKHICSCGATSFIKKKFSGNGTLVTFTQVNSRCIGLVALEEGVTILAQLADVQLKNLSIGMPVKAVFRKLYEQGPTGIIHYGIKFVSTQTI